MKPLFRIYEKKGLRAFGPNDFLGSTRPARPARRGRWRAGGAPRHPQKVKKTIGNTMFCDSAGCVPETLIKPLEDQSF